MQPAVGEHFELAADGAPPRAVRGRVVLPAKRTATNATRPPPAVLLLHGFKGFMDWGFFPLLARELCEHGMAAVAFNFSGSGMGADLVSFTEDEAFAKDTLTKQLADVERVREHVERELAGRRGLVDAGRLGIFGHSRGGGIALIHAAERGDYRAIVTWAAIPDMERFDRETMALWRRQGFIHVHNSRTGRDHRLDLDLLRDVEQHHDRFDILAAARRSATPTLLVHGALDDVVLPEALERLAAAIPAPYGRAELIPGAGHTLGARHPLGSHVPPELARAVDLTTEHFAHALVPQSRNDG